MEFQHKPVLLDEVIENLNIDKQGIYVDGTLGGGGHGGAICDKLEKNGVFIGIDRDQDALKVARDRLDQKKCRKIFIQNNYKNILQVLEDNQLEYIDGGLLDLGLSSFQIDNPKRGFSYMQEAPLDMRMNKDDSLTAEMVVNKYTEGELTHIIRTYGEEKWAVRISKFIVEQRREKAIRTTGELVEIIKKAIPIGARQEGSHPAKRTFQGIRIEVNEELEGIKEAVEAFISVLGSKGRLAIITFHSLEDRIVKEAFLKHEKPCVCPKEFPICICGKTPDGKRISRKPIVPSLAEIKDNSRSKSAKLRVFEKK